MSPLGHFLAVAFALSLSSGLPSDANEAARFKSGLLPVASPLASAGGLVALSVAVDDAGNVAGIEDVVSADPFTGPLRETVSGWRFRPATEDGRPVPSKVLVTAVFGTPVLAGTNPLAPDAPVPGKRSAGPLPVPVPKAAIVPDFPPTAFVAGTVLVEVDINQRGDVTAARVSASSPALDDAALTAARRFKFDPAKHEGRPVSSVAYIAFAFRQPITTTERP